MNFHRISKQLGVAHSTIVSYYEILEDCLIIEKIAPITRSHSRKKLTKSQKYLFFDLGIRRLAAKEGLPHSQKVMGHLFEQFVGLELLRCARFAKYKTVIRFWRDPDGPELDWVIESDGLFTPIEVKWHDTPSLKDIRHINIFLNEYDNVEQGYVICRTPRKVQLDARITAIPWQEIGDLISI